MMCVLILQSLPPCTFLHVGCRKHVHFAVRLHVLRHCRAECRGLVHCRDVRRGLHRVAVCAGVLEQRRRVELHRHLRRSVLRPGRA